MSNEPRRSSMVLSIPGNQMLEHARALVRDASTLPLCKMSRTVDCNLVGMMIRAPHSRHLSCVYNSSCLLLYGLNASASRKRSLPTCTNWVTLDNTKSQRRVSRAVVAACIGNCFLIKQ